MTKLISNKQPSLRRPTRLDSFRNLHPRSSVPGAQLSLTIERWDYDGCCFRISHFSMVISIAMEGSIVTKLLLRWWCTTCSCTSCRRTITRTSTLVATPTITKNRWQTVETKNFTQSCFSSQSQRLRSSPPASASCGANCSCPGCTQARARRTKKVENLKRSFHIINHLLWFWNMSQL